MVLLMRAPLQAGMVSYRGVIAGSPGSCEPRWLAAEGSEWRLVGRPAVAESAGIGSRPRVLRGAPAGRPTIPGGTTLAALVALTAAAAESAAAAA